MYASIKFLGELDNTTVNDLQKKLDYSITKLDERMEFMNNLLDETEFFELYFDTMYKCNISTSDPLSEDNNVCELLENYASYLLNAEELKKERKANKVEYMFVTDRNYFNRKVTREQSLEKLTEVGAIDNVIPFLVREDKNYLLTKGQKIKGEDFCGNEEMAEIMRQYRTFRDLAKKELDELEALSTRNYYLSRFIEGANDDMKRVKDSYLGTIDFKRISSNTGSMPDLDVIDFTNEKHIETLLRMNNEQGVDGSDLSLILLDFQMLIDRCNFSPVRLETIELLRDNHSLLQISKMRGVNYNAVTGCYRGIIKTIVSMGDKYDLEEK